MDAFSYRRYYPNLGGNKLCDVIQKTYIYIILLALLITSCDHHITYASFQPSVHAFQRLYNTREMFALVHGDGEVNDSSQIKNPTFGSDQLCNYNVVFRHLKFAYFFFLILYKKYTYIYMMKTAFYK